MGLQVLAAAEHMPLGQKEEQTAERRKTGRSSDFLNVIDQENRADSF